MRKYSITGTGPLTRSTVGGGAVDPQFEITNDVLHWIWSWRIQVERHADSTHRDGVGSTPLERRRAFSRTSYDEHMLTVVGSQLIKAIRRAEAQFEESLFDGEAAPALTLLRNIYEHWDEQRPAFADPGIPKVKSGKNFAELFPHGRPWSVTYVDNDLVLGEVVSIHSVTIELDDVESRILTLEDRLRSEGPANPDRRGFA